MSLEEFEFVVYPAKTLTWDDAAKWFRDAIVKLGLVQMQLSVLPFAEGWWSNADKLMLAGGAVLTHQNFAKESDDEGWAMRLYYIDHKTKTGVIGYVPPWPFDSSGHSTTWGWLIGFVERLVQACDPDLCFVSGSGSGDNEDEGLPLKEEIVPPVPRAVTPWMYLGPLHLTPAIREGLGSLPAFSSRPLGDGWLLRPVDYFCDELPPAFLRAYERLAGGPVRFLRGTLDPPQPSRSKSRTVKRGASRGKRR